MKSYFQKSKDIALNFYKSIDELPLYNFDKYLNTQNNCWFLKEFQQIESIELNEIENKIIDEYYKAIDDRTFVVKLQKIAKINNLKTKIYFISALIERFSNGFEDINTRLLFVKELKKWGFIIPEINTSIGDLEEIETIYKSLGGIKTQIDILQSELKEDGKKESVSLYKQIVIAKSHLIGYEMNPKVMTVLEWIEISKILKEKQANE